jgi:FixJ family two-component response regulator
MSQLKESEQSSTVAAVAASSSLIAILDDEKAVREALGRLLRSLGFQTEYFALATDFLESLSSHFPDCLILDLHLPGLTGLDVLNHLFAKQIRIPTIMITGLDLPGMRERAIAAGANSYLIKPLDESVLMQAINASIQPSP